MTIKINTMKVVYKKFANIFFCLVSLVLFSCNDDNSNFREELHEVSFNEVGEKIYVRSKKWGVSWDHEETVLSNSIIDRSFQINKDRDFIFYTSNLFYKKVGNDSLLLYVNYSSIPKELPSNFSNKVKVKILELKSTNEIADYDLNYHKYGLTKIHVPSKAGDKE